MDRSATVELARLLEQEREISQQRQLLHRRIDRVYLAAPLSDEDSSLLDDLETREQDISAERRRLHVRIDEFRAEHGLPPTREDRTAESRA